MGKRVNIHYKVITYVYVLQSSGDPVTQCDFHPTEENSIVCCGKSQISFWTFIKAEKKLDKKMGIFGV